MGKKLVNSTKLENTQPNQTEAYKILISFLGFTRIWKLLKGENAFQWYIFCFPCSHNLA